MPWSTDGDTSMSLNLLSGDGLPTAVSNRYDPTALLATDGNRAWRPSTGTSAISPGKVTLMHQKRFSIPIFIIAGILGIATFFAAMLYTTSLLLCFVAAGFMTAGSLTTYLVFTGF
jgi:VIT1/CCC1 family predicted Fe2+/Mn2+ transporter